MGFGGPVAPESEGNSVRRKERAPYRLALNSMTTLMNRPIGLFNFWLALCLMCGEVGAQTPQQQPARKADLASMNIEDLMNITVTSVSKEEQKMSKAAAAIFVITQEDISRSGATNIPDLLRMVPGLDVSQINANSWAVSARGFNQQFTNKLLVLIDGRAVYSPLLGGVNWDTQDVPLEDFDRIEVIRGPGATIWGDSGNSKELL